MPLKLIGLTLALSLLGAQLAPVFNALAGGAKIDLTAETASSEPESESSESPDDSDFNECETTLAAWYTDLTHFFSLSSAPALTVSPAYVSQVGELERPPRV